MYHRAGLQNFHLETGPTTFEVAVRSGVVILSQYVFPRQCSAKTLYTMELPSGSHEHL
jgi:hypothetical protein